MTHITPPLELVQQWAKDRALLGDCRVPIHGYIATRAAQWGADQELEACCDWVSQWRCEVGGNRPEVGLRAARRPKPPSLKQQALAALDHALEYDVSSIDDETVYDTIRRALKALPE